jgi:hypothetical protein
MDPDNPKTAADLHDLNERAKELRCLYQVNELLNRTELSLAQILRGIVQVIPPAWQFPEQCQAHIIFEDQFFESYDYRRSRWVQSANIIVQGENLGSIEVSYREAVPASDKNPFLMEERKLIDTIAEQIAGEVRQRRFNALTEADTGQAGNEHWKWRYQMAERIAVRLDPQRFGVRGFYLIGSTKNATAGAASDIDLLLHFGGTEEQRIGLALWLEGWSCCLAEMNFLRTGYRCDGLLDVHLVTDEDIAAKSSYAVKIGAITDAARQLPMKKK